jgi:hypothetical protein
MGYARRVGEKVVIVLEQLSGFHPVMQALLGGLFTWALTALGAVVVAFTLRPAAARLPGGAAACIAPYRVGQTLERRRPVVLRPEPMVAGRRERREQLPGGRTESTGMRM